jgi:uncharacterized protein (TIGR04141 family)
MARKKKCRKLTVLLLKESIGSCAQALRYPDSLQCIDFKRGIKLKGQFWYANPSINSPSWLDFVAPILDRSIQGFKVASVSAVLFIEEEKRWFAFTFGHGRNLLKFDSFELGFGLRVALNRIDYQQIRSMDVKTYEELVMSTRKDASRRADLAPFGLDISRDLLRAVTGEPQDKKFASRITGKDSLTLLVDIDIEELNQKCNEILNAYRDNRYKAHFDWVDHLEEVRDKDTCETLNVEFLNALKQKNTGKMYLAAPEPLEWENVESFKISGTRSYEYRDLDIDEYLAKLNPETLNKITIDNLKSFRVSVKFSNDNIFIAKWPLFSCFVWETNYEDKLFTLLEGKWFQVETNFANNVKSFVSGILERDGYLPDAEPGEREDNYNKRVARENSGLFYCLDKKLIKPEGAISYIEFCDLCSKDKKFIYVKRKSRSSTLSHLFSQGAIAARTFLEDSVTRTKLSNLLPSEWQSIIPNPAERPSPVDYEILYAVLAKDKTSVTGLPFFTQLNLMHHVKLLRQLGYNIAFSSIGEKTPGVVSNNVSHMASGSPDRNPKETPGI